ncbi:MAG TPA: carboxypeptidase-like regulatory domain-containing protein [Vicinamibacterales bacterium]|nr:carboxypeptidase-like regulatory domain-containing protein [Vicinamibacterales bacterium]
MADLSLILWPSSAIAGVVRDASGRATSGMAVRLFDGRADASGTVEPRLIAATTTDDRGDYRFFHLRDGEYVIAASGGRGGGESRAFVYHPSAARFVDARRLSLEVGQELTGIDVAFTPAPPVFIGGTIRLATGEPASLYRLSALLRSTYGTIPTTYLNVNRDGRIADSNVPSGDYQLIVRADRLVRDAAGVEPSAQPGTLWAQRQLTVPLGGVTDLSVTCTPGITLDGQVVFAASAVPPRAPVRLKLQSLQVPDFASTADVEMTPGKASLFRFGDLLPGPYRLVTEPQSPLPRSWSASLRLNDVDAPDDVIDVPAAPDSSLHVNFSLQLSEFNGRLLDKSDRPAVDFFVVLFPIDPRLWTVGTRRVQQARPATDGSFMVSGLPAGDYYLAVLTDVDSRAMFDRTFLGGLAQSNPFRLTLTPGENPAQTLRVGAAR